MKTNQILTRKMGGFEVLQRTSDGYFDANALLAQWNKSGKNERKISLFMELKQTSEFMDALRDELSQGDKNYSPDTQLIIKGKVSTDKKGNKTPAKVWMHPYLFIKFAMWINPRFEVKVIKFVYDQLIEYRNEAGNAYKEMSSSVAKLVDKSFMPVAIQNVAKAINHIVFGVHESEIRNKQADESKMKELFELEKDVAKSINRGLIKTYESLMGYLRDVWREKWQPKCLTA